MSVPPFSALPLDEVPDDQKAWAEKWAKTLNTQNAAVQQILSGGVSLSENATSGYYKIRVAGGVFPVQFRVGSGTPATGLVVARIVDVDAPTTVCSLAQVQWIPKEDQILIQNVTGLTKGRKYDLTLLALFDKPTTPAAALVKSAPSNASSQTDVVPAATAWTAWSPEWSAVTAAPVLGDGSLAGFYRRVGDSLDVRIEMKCGSTSTYGTGAWLFNLPNGYLIDFNKIPMPGGGAIWAQPIGMASLHDSGTAYFQGLVSLYSQTKVQMWALATGGTYASYTSVISTVPMTWANGDQLAIFFSVPIAGWSAGGST